MVIEIVVNKLEFGKIILGFWKLIINEEIVYSWFNLYSLSNFIFNYNS